MKVIIILFTIVVLAVVAISEISARKCEDCDYEGRYRKVPAINTKEW